MHPMSHRHSGPKKAISWALRFGFEGREGAAPAFAFPPFLPGPLPTPPAVACPPTLHLLVLGFPWICQLQEGSRVCFLLGGDRPEGQCGPVSTLEL